MFVAVLVAVGAVFLVLGFAHVVTLLLGLAIAVVCLLAAFLVGGGLGSFTRRV